MYGGQILEVNAARPAERDVCAAGEARMRSFAVRGAWSGRVLAFDPVLAPDLEQVDPVVEVRYAGQGGFWG
jgi:hypothetical protein